MTLEELIARILRDLREKAEAQFGARADAAVVGRPVRFVGADSAEDSDFAEGRLREAFGIAGFQSIEFELEPVAAAHYYESTLDHDELILIGDFGGGTSDFSLLRVGPEIRRRGRASADLLGNGGVGLAGDAFDAKIVRQSGLPRPRARVAGAQLQEDAAGGAELGVRQAGALAPPVVSAHELPCCTCCVRLSRRHSSRSESRR